MQNTTGRPKITVTADGRGVASYAGTRLLADLADVSGRTEGFGEALSDLRLRAGGHDPGRVEVDLAVMVADGGAAISHLAVLRDQPALFGRVASTATAWRVLAGIDERRLGALRRARATARERLWSQRAETGRPVLDTVAGGRSWPGLVIDLDATLVIAHSEKEGAAPTFKGGFGFHPLLAWLDNTDEALAAILRPGNAGANTAADHIAVVDLALAQLPDAARHGTPILVRADGAGATKEWLVHLRGLREHGCDVRFSVGFTMTAAVQDAIRRLPEMAWNPRCRSTAASVRAPTWRN